MQCLNDELVALQMAYTVLENRFRTLEQDNTDLVTRWMAQKQEVANKMNAENDAFRDRQREDVQRKIQEATEKQITVDPGRYFALVGFVILCLFERLKQLLTFCLFG